MSNNTTPWWISFYEDAPVEHYLQRVDQDDLDATLDFLVRELGLQPGDRVFDQCCGTGSLAIPLAQRGYSLLGVDLCRKFIRLAHREATSKGISADFYTGDACAFSPAKPCAGAFNWYTSFGYYEDDAVNGRMIDCAFDALAPGGKFALEFSNMLKILGTFKEVMTYEVDSPSGKIKLERRCRFDMERRLMHQTWTWIFPDGKRSEQKSTVKMYTEDDLTRLFITAGFSEVKVYGGIDGTPVNSLESPRLIAVGTKL